MADDWSAPHTSAYGDQSVDTPNRTSILTGQHHWRLKEGDSLGGSLRKKFPVYTRLLEEAGYHTRRYEKGVWPSKHTFRNRDSFGDRFQSFHELAHAYHEQVLTFGHPEILAAQNNAAELRSYDKIERAPKSPGTQPTFGRVYAMVDHKEYFAEAFFAKNDFFPFDKSQLKAHDRGMHEVLQNVWGTTE